MTSLIAHSRVRVSTMLRDAGRRVGLEVRRSGAHSRDDLRLAHFLAMHDVDLVVDIGANAGQFGQDLIGVGYRGRIVSFEPVPDAHAELSSVARAKGGGRWDVAERLALSDREGEAIFHVGERSTSSSFSKPLDSLVAQTPSTAVTASISVRVARLDSVAASYFPSAARVFVKLDAQGSEDLVLRGAEQTLRSTVGVLTELSFAQLYEQQAKAEDVHQLLVAAGLELWDVWPGYRDPRTLRLNQIDGLYFRPASDIGCGGSGA